MLLKSCPKGYTQDQDKALPPEETVRRVQEILEAKGQGILAETRRIDTGRLGIPVYMSICGPRAREVMPTRKQMGKGASPVQAEASALMELMERYSFFSFWSNDDNFEELTFSQAEARWPGQVIPVSQMLQAVGEALPEDSARKILDLRTFRFAKALHIASGSHVWLPMDFFKLLNEFNGSCAGNTPEEAVLQGGCELVERHVSALVDREAPQLPTVDAVSLGDPVVDRLLECYRAQGVQVVLKDMTLGMPVTTIGALAWDPSTLPDMSEIVFTAGTAASPAKAVIRALTEVAQLAGDFHTGSNYEASGLSKYQTLDEAAWLRDGPTIAAQALPSIERSDIRDELRLLADGLEKLGFALYAVDTTDPELGVSAAYTIVPGFAFRERSPRASLGLFVGRLLAEQDDSEEAVRGLAVLATLYPESPFIPFYEALIALHSGDIEVAALKFERAGPLQPDQEDAGLCAFYAAYALSQAGRWSQAMPLLDRAVALSPDVKEYHNLRGVGLFKAGLYEDASACFQAALNLDSGSAMDLANLGLCCKFLGRTDEAREYLDAALRLDPSMDFARDHLKELQGLAGGES